MRLSLIDIYTHDTTDFAAFIFSVILKLCNYEIIIRLF